MGDPRDKSQGQAAEAKLINREDTSWPHIPEIVGRSAALQQVLQLIRMVAPTDSTVLLLGETGTGKELMARAVHQLSRRSQEAFVTLSCAAIPADLLESELFGYEKGAFTGAGVEKLGRLELANRGTLFLDEVGDLPFGLQPKLLRVLEAQEFEHLGSNRTQKIDIRVVAATHRDLAEMLAKGRFRRDLYYRLHVFPLRIPALRERREDIPLLVHHFMRKYSQSMNRNLETIPKATMEALVNWDWPGNIRELQNLVEHAVILSPGPILDVPLEELKPPK
jgi:formate hydrogenlyase transcriptional activator